MALETINIGVFANDGTGDDLRTAFSKINNNFEELESIAGQNNTISNVGPGFGLYKEKIGVDLRLKTLVQGDGILLTNNPTNIVIENNRNVIVSVNADTGSLTASTTSQAINIVGGAGINTVLTGNTLTINSANYNLETDTSPTLGGNLDLNGYNIVGGPGTSVSANVFIGNLAGNVGGNVIGNLFGLVNNINITDISNEIMTFDFGSLNGNITNPMNYMLKSVLIDMGTINIGGVNSENLDFGSFV